MESHDLLYEVRDGTARLTLNREPQRNAISPEMIGLFNEYLDRAAGDDAVRVVLITGAGEKVFCSGADLGAALGGGEVAGGALNYARLLQKMAAYPKPLVARLNGHCLAGGMGLMLGCDIVYAREGIKIGTPEVKVGLFPMMIGALIFRNATRKKALEMIYTARLLSAGEAEKMGLITRVYPAGELDEALDKTLSAISANAPLAIRIGRQALAAAEDMELNQALEYLAGRLGDVLETEDAAEGLTAFMQKRDPEWKGR